jgi:hypothetical protein
MVAAVITDRRLARFRFNDQHIESLVRQIVEEAKEQPSKRANWTVKENGNRKRTHNESDDEEEEDDDDDIEVIQD